MSEMKQYLETFRLLLPLNKSISVPEAEKRASEFLSAMATITEWRHVLFEEKIRCTSIQSAVYSEQLNKGESSTITANKITAEASQEYILAREELERIENDLNYLKAYYELFHNGHLFYRQMAKGESF